jgi:hypothetical protein
MWLEHFEVSARRFDFEQVTTHVTLPARASEQNLVLMRHYNQREHIIKPYKVCHRGHSDGAEVDPDHARGAQAGGVAGRPRGYNRVHRRENRPPVWSERNESQQIRQR